MKVYLINGESYLLINEEVNKIVKDNKNISIFDMNVSSLEDALIEAGYVSMFDEEKYIIIKNSNLFSAGKSSEKETEILMHYLEDGNKNATIIFICYDKIDTRKKTTKAIKEKYSLISIPNLKSYEIENRVNDFFKKLNYKIDNDTIKYIISNSLANYDIVMSEISKIILYYNEPCYIKHDDVVNIVSKSINSNNFLFVDAIVDNDLAKSIELLNDLKIMKTEPTALISLIARDFRIMYNIKTLLESGKREYEIMTMLGLADWQFNKYLNKIFPYKIKELEEILLKLSKLDLDIKSGKIDRFMGLELFILDICE